MWLYMYICKYIYICMYVCMYVCIYIYTYCVYIYTHLVVDFWFWVQDQAIFVLCYPLDLLPARAACQKHTLAPVNAFLGPGNRRRLWASRLSGLNFSSLLTLDVLSGMSQTCPCKQSPAATSLTSRVSLNERCGVPNPVLCGLCN